MIVVTMKRKYQIRPATTTWEFEKAKELLTEYFDHLRIDHQFYERENGLDTMKQSYAAPEGILYLLYDKKEPIGCGALRKLDDEIAELRRMYIKFEYQGLGLSNELLESLIQLAKEKGYRKIRLDTLPAMASAIHLYEKYGFREIERYNDNPAKDARFFQLDL